MAYKKMTPERECELAAKAQAGDEQARNELIECNMGLVRSIASSYRDKGIDLEDLIQEGSIGLMKAVDKFDPKRGARLSTYAYMWIKRQVQSSFVHLLDAVQVPDYVSQKAIKVNATYIEMSHELGREPTRGEIAERLGITEETIDLTMLASTTTVSADAQIGEDDEDSLHLADVLMDNSKYSRNDGTEVADRDLVEMLLKELSPRDQNIIRMRFNLDNQGERTHKTIASVLGFTSEGIRQAEMRAIKTMRNAAETLA